MRNRGAAIRVFKRLLLCLLLQLLQTPWVTVFQIKRQEVGWSQTRLLPLRHVHAGMGWGTQRQEAPWKTPNLRPTADIHTRGLSVSM